MSDARLREAERRWRETGTVDDEAAYLREALRAGLATPERLAAAGALWLEAAAATVSGAPPALERQAAQVALATLDLRLRLGLLPLHADPGALLDGQAAWERALDALEAWAACPCGPHRQEVRARTPEARAARGRPSRVPTSSGGCGSRSRASRATWRPRATTRRRTTPTRCVSACAPGASARRCPTWPRSSRGCGPGWSGTRWRTSRASPAWP